ncbi:MAG: DUF4147 domain-containing protein [Clostridia bacterium]|nr:DUF4147 domain-containing protein [Clostridia bacterium]
MKTEIEKIVSDAIAACDPEENVYRIVSARTYDLPPVVISIGKAAAAQARGAARALNGRFKKGVIVTKYGHADNPPAGFEIIEAGHPVPDENSERGAEAALNAVNDLSAQDAVLLLVSGGGSALFEKSAVPLARLRAITDEMLRKGCEIAEINAVRKKLSLVKGGRFAAACAPARVENLLLSDVLGDPPEIIASGPGVQDDTPDGFAAAVAERYGLSITDGERALLLAPAPRIENAGEPVFTGNLSILLTAAKKSAEALGYETRIVNDALTGEARDRAREFCGFLIEEQKKHPQKKRAYIMGGETTVTVRGSGKGGRNQEFALAAAKYLDGTDGVTVFAVGSDGTDGPTLNAGGFADGATAERIRAGGRSVDAYLAENDSAAALALCDSLIVTGPTGTNVNDLYMGLLGPTRSQDRE